MVQSIFEHFKNNLLSVVTLGNFKSEYGQTKSAS